MKPRKWKSYAKLAIAMAVGGCFGIASAWAMEGVGVERVEELLRGIRRWLDESYLVLGILFGILVLTVNVGGLLYCRGLIRKTGQTEEDAELERLEKRIGFSHGMLLTVSMTLFILSMMLLGLCTKESARGLLGVSVFLGTLLMAAVFQTLVIHQIQKWDPRLKGDPNGLHFHRDWLNSCDEAERLEVYRKCYKAYLAMGTVFPCVMVAALLIKFTFQTDGEGILLVGILWLAQTIAGTHCMAALK